MSNSMHEEILAQLNWRYATKKFNSDKKISDSDWKTLEVALQLAPSSYGLQPFQFIVVKNPEVRKKLTPSSYGQPQIEACSHLVVVTHLKTLDEKYVASYIQNTASTRGVSEKDLAGFYETMVGDLVKGPRSATISHWAARQAYISMGVFMTTASLLKIDVCPMEGFNPAGYDDILELKNTPYTSVALMAAGYRSDDDNYQHAKKVRMDKKQLIKHI